MHWDTVISNIDARMETHRERYLMGNVATTKGTGQIKHLLSNVEVDYLLNCPDDYNRFSEYVYPRLDFFRRLIDTAYTKKIRRDMFMGNGTAEIFVAVELESPMSNLPFGSGYSAWAHLKPFRYLFYDSVELQHRYDGNVTKFASLPPEYGVILIDPIILIFKYMKYIEEGMGDIDDIFLDNEFMQTAVFNSVFEDFIDVWSVNVFLRALRAESPMDTLELHDDVSGSSGIISGSAQSGIKDLQSLIAKVKEGKVSPEEVLATPIINGVSPIDKMGLMLKEMGVPDLRQNEHVKFIVELPYIEMILRLFHMSPKKGAFSKIRKVAKRQFTRLERNKSIENLADGELRELITEKVEELSELL